MEALCLASRAGRSARQLPNPSPVLPSYFVTVVRADPAVPKMITLKRSSSARSNTAVFLSVFSPSPVAVGSGRVDAPASIFKSAVL